MRDLILKVHISVVATLFPLVEGILPLRSLLALVEQPAGWTPYRGVSAERIIKLIDRRLRRPRLMRRRRCLRQGTMLFHFLRLAGVPSSMHFAVLEPAAPDRPLLAHCWVNVSGQDIYPPLGNSAVLVSRSYSPSLG